MELNLRNRPKTRLTINFDEPIGDLTITAPKKADYDRILELLEKSEEKSLNDFIQSAYEAVWMILSGSPDFHCSKEELEELLDISEARSIIRAWDAFIMEIYLSKNA